LELRDGKRVGRDRRRKGAAEVSVNGSAAENRE
jgi:hypothetical protein